MSGARGMNDHRDNGQGMKRINADCRDLLSDHLGAHHSGAPRTSCTQCSAAKRCTCSMGLSV
eukprot:4218444-Alexandrium_andersonii.AAC.1